MKRLRSREPGSQSTNGFRHSRLPASDSRTNANAAPRWRTHSHQIFFSSRLDGALLTVPYRTSPVRLTSQGRQAIVALGGLVVLCRMSMRVRSIKRLSGITGGSPDRETVRHAILSFLEVPLSLERINSSRHFCNPGQGRAVLDAGAPFATVKAIGGPFFRSGTIRRRRAKRDDAFLLSSSYR